MSLTALIYSIVASLLTVAKVIMIYRGSTRKENPTSLHPLSWLVWAALSIVTLAPQLVVAGWEWVMLFGVTTLLANVTVVLLARKQGFKRFKRNDWVMVCIATCGIAGWLIVRDPYIALWCSLIADMTGVVAMWKKIVSDPFGELIVVWLLGAASAALASISSMYTDEPITRWYPFYVTGNALSCALLIWIGRVIINAWRKKAVAEEIESLAATRSGTVPATTK